MNEHSANLKLIRPDSPKGDKEEKEKDFFELFLNYTRGTEVPAFFYRWAAIGALGAWLGRDIHIKFGTQEVYPNLYVLLLGEPGTKKSTAIKTARNLLKKAGFNKFSAEKTSKEKFLMDLGGLDDLTEGESDFLDTNIFDDDEVREVFIAADEFNDFFGNNILEFVSLLGVLWDYRGVYENKVKNGQSVKISEPTVSILGGTTATTFSNTFPQEVIGQGFFSRVISIHAKPTGKRITWPYEPTEEETKEIIDYLRRIKTHCAGRLTFSEEAYALVDTIYQTWVEVDDVRFASYSNRRHTHFLKLIAVHTAARCSRVVEKQDVIYANTVLHHAEQYMPQAYGEFGQSRNSILTHKIMQILTSIRDGEYPTTHDLWGKMQADFDRLDGFMTLLQGMAHAGKIHTVNGKVLPKARKVEAQYNGTIDYAYLTNEEINL